MRRRQGLGARARAASSQAPLLGGTYLTTSPIMTADWKPDSGSQWTVPVGGGIGHLFHLGRLPLNTQVGAYCNVARPDFGPNWQFRAQLQLRFPK